MGSDRFDFTIRDRAVYFPSSDTLILADLHLGKIQASRLMLPADEVEPILQRIAELVEECDPSTMIVAGDILHDFANVPPTVEAALEEFRRRVTELGIDLIILRGNHDTLLDTQLDTAATFQLDDGTVVCHGHEPPPIDGSRYVIGHDHPAISIEGDRRPCFLHGDGIYRSADVLALPAFSHLIPGTPINNLTNGELQSPLLHQLTDCRPIIYNPKENEPLVFPPLHQFQEIV